MSRPLLLASGSATRLALLRAAGLEVTVSPARIDEVTLRLGLMAEQTSSRDIADVLAELKCRKIAKKNVQALVLGCDQILEFQGAVWGKPATADLALAQLQTLRGKRHSLFSALVLYDEGQPVWRHVSTAHLTMRDISDAWLTDYVRRNWDNIRHSAGSYLIEQEGIRLFQQIEGDYFTILGLPMLPLLTYLAGRGFIDT